MRFFILLCAFLFMSCIRNGPTRPEDITSNQVIINVSERLNKKYGLKLGAIGGAVDKEGVYDLDASYDLYGSKMIDIAEARDLIVDCVEEFLKEANSNKEFRPYMKVYPFTAKNLSISILIFGDNRTRLRLPYISTISMRKSIITYKSLTSDMEKYRYEREIEESYEEALKLSKRNNTVN